MKSFRKTSLVAALICLAFQTNASAMDQASYTVSGTAGNWTLDFTFTNGLGINSRPCKIPPARMNARLAR